MEISNEQLALVNERIAQLLHADSFYGKRLREHGIDGVSSPEDFKKLPFSEKKDLRDAYPFGFFAVPRGELARIHASSGTTGKPTFVGYTKKDMKLWADLCARFLVAGGLTSDQLVQVSFGYGLFTGGFGLHGGIERVGAAVLPASSGNTQRQILLLEDGHLTALTPAELDAYAAERRMPSCGA